MIHTISVVCVETCILHATFKMKLIVKSRTHLHTSANEYDSYY